MKLSVGSAVAILLLSGWRRQSPEDFAENPVVRNTKDFPGKDHTIGENAKTAKRVKKAPNGAEDERKALKGVPKVLRGLLDGLKTVFRGKEQAIKSEIRFLCSFCELYRSVSELYGGSPEDGRPVCRECALAQKMSEQIMKKINGEK